MGSVKDLTVLEEPEADKPGRGRFVFSDRYSVFDYGEMPDLIEGKGSALCLMSAYFFELAEKEGMKTHYLGLVSDGKLVRIEELDSPTNTMEVKLYRVIRPAKLGKSYDYSEVRKAEKNYLIPLEVIYRNVLPEGSSVFKRLKKGVITPEQLGLDHMPVPGERLERPVVEVSTKLESEDRYLSWEEAKKIAGLEDNEVEEIKDLALKMDNLITRETAKAGIENLDGKFEFAFDENRKVVFVDAVGTPDECRFSFEGVQISKEVLRRYYRKTEWYRKIEELKGTEGWREVAKPPKLPEELVKVVSDMYKACCNEVTGVKFFDVDRLSEVVKRLLEISEKLGV